jgi:hypothetical protein
MNTSFKNKLASLINAHHINERNAYTAKNQFGNCGVGL